jgi:hypothetical protein
MIGQIQKQCRHANNQDRWFSRETDPQSSQHCEAAQNEAPFNGENDRFNGRREDKQQSPVLEYLLKNSPWQKNKGLYCNVSDSLPSPFSAQGKPNDGGESDE